MDRERQTPEDEQARLVALLEAKGHRRPQVVIIGGTWPQQYRISVAVNGVMRGVSGTYAEIERRIKALPETRRG